MEFATDDDIFLFLLFFLLSLILGTCCRAGDQIVCVGALAVPRKQ